MMISVSHLQPAAALIAGIMTLVIPRLLNGILGLTHTV